MSKVPYPNYNKGNDQAVYKRYPSQPVFPNSHSKPKPYNNNPGSYPLQNNNKSCLKGNHHETKFGKYHDKTWYEIANIRDFNYLKWCINTDVIQLNPNCKSHIWTAMHLKEDKQAEWSAKTEVKDDDTLLTYEATINNEKVTSPTIILRTCKTCNQDKPVDSYTGSSTSCSDCYKE